MSTTAHPGPHAARRALIVLASFVLGLTLFVILWGAWVRISHSGDGCGAHWPLCHGRFVPESGGKTWVEYLHRITSGMLGFAVLALFLAVQRYERPGHPCRKAAAALLLLTITEALLGAKLVLFGLVGSDTSSARAVAVALHLVNTMLLLGSNIFLLVWLLLTGPDSRIRSLASLGVHWVGGVALLTVALTGAWAALANTLFPSTSLWTGFLADFHEESHLLVRLRFLHPVTALLVGLYLTIRWPRSLSAIAGPPRLLGLANWFVPLLWTTLLFGIATLFALSPVWMKLSHLLLADALWMIWAAATAGMLLGPQDFPRR